LDLIGNSAVTIRNYGTIVHKHKLVLELTQRGFLTNRPPRWLALYGYLRLIFVLGRSYLFIGEMNIQYIEYLLVSFSYNPLPVANIYNYVVVYHMQSQFIAKYENSHLITRKYKTCHNSS
jgi:hypothetical protein